jgi:phage gpG-like protein
MPVRLEITMIPGAALMRAAFEGLGMAISKFDDPLRDCIEKVMAPSIRTNFDVGGRPPWEPDEPQTNIHRALKGERGGGPLVVTGALRGAASSVGAWSFSTESAELTSTEVPYGIFHQEGTATIPARPWGVVQPEDEDAMAEVFASWIERKAREFL